MSVFDNLTPVKRQSSVFDKLTPLGKVQPAMASVTPPQPFNYGDAALGVAKGTAEMGAAGVNEFARGAGNLAATAGQALDVINPVNVFSNITGIGKPVSIGAPIGKAIQSGTSGIADYNTRMLQQNSGFNPQSGASNVGRVLGDVGVNMAAMPLLPKIAPVKIPSHPIINALANTAITSPMTTTTAVGVTQGRLPTPEEFAQYGAMDLILTGIGAFGSKMYKSAFKGTKGQEKNLVNAYGTTVGETAEKLGYTGNPSQIRTQAKDAMRGLWDEMEKVAVKSPVITPETFKEVALRNLTKPFVGLPESNFKVTALKTVSDLVDSYTPLKPMTGTEGIALISELNKGLFGAGNVVALNPKQLDSMASQLKMSVKEMLPAELGPLYKEYASNELIKKVMDDSEVKRLILRSTLGGLAGAGYVGSSTYGATQDPIQSIQNAILGGIIGGLGLRATGSTALMTKMGMMLKTTGSPVGQIFYKSLIENIKKELNKS